MGIDIYLNGYEEFEARTEKERAAYVAEAKRDGPGKENYEDARRALDAIYCGENGYIRSAYSSMGLFPVLEEIYGFDVAGYLFPGDWSENVPVDGAEFVGKVDKLRKTAILAVRDKQNFALPWTDEFSEVAGERAPDSNPDHDQAEAFGELLRQMLAAAGLGEPEWEKKKMLSPGHAWYITEGLAGLRRFGELSERINREGRPTFAHISY